MYEARVLSTMLNGSETWEANNAELHRLCRDDRTMIWWICDTIDRDKTPTASLLQKFGIKDITSAGSSDGMAMYNRPRPVSNLSHFPNTDTTKQWKPRKTWSECVKTDISKCGLASVDQQDSDV